ncbi:MAG TPA: hypothetical protein VM901_05525, partial [Bdellovibrionota bacterium]|nr:hypothetical protein [Bdellovibrionota bacterium]
MAKNNNDDDIVDKKVIREDDPSLTESFAGESLESIEELLGSRRISPNAQRALLRFASGRLDSELLKALKIKAPRGSAPFIAGPFKLSEIEAWSAHGLLTRSDLVQVPFRRWLPASEYVSVFQKQEMTATMEVTSSFTLSGSKTVEMDENDSNTPTPNHEISQPGLELEAESAPVSEVRTTRSQTGVVPSPLVAARASNPAPSKAVVPKHASHTVDSSTELSGKRSAVWGVAAVFLVVLFFSVKALVRGPVDKSAVPTTSGESVPPGTQQLDLSADWPDWMKPLPTEALLLSDDAMMARLGTLIERVRFGVYALGESEQQTLRRLSNPATASWAARKTASNMLAVWMGLRGGDQVSAAIEVLRPIYEASPDDYVTVVNLAMLTMESGNLAGAEELAQVGLRLCGQATCWFSNLVMASIKTRLGQMSGAEKHFQDAATDFADPVATYGAWSLALLQADATKYAPKVKGLLERAVWGDPDRFQHSPLPDATGFPLIYGKLATALGPQLGAPALGLSAGQQEFLKWRLNVMAGKASLGDSASLLASLATETSPLSQLLSAYVLSQRGELDASRERLASILVLIKDTQASQGWPWTLAGDLQSERGQVDQALVFYQSALGR